MRKIILLLTLCCQVLGLIAQTKAPKWMDKQRKAVVSITTYGKDNQEKARGTGFFITETGEVLSGFSLFPDAVRATITDADGNTYPVSRILGADELYDVIRLQAEVPKKVVCLPLAQEPLATGATAYLTPYSPKAISSFGLGSVMEVSKLKDTYSYYKISAPLESGQENAPWLNEAGEVFGLAQADASGKKEVSYALSAGYANSLRVLSADALSSAYSRIRIPKAWPSDVNQAQVTLFLLASAQDPMTYLATLDDFIATFPNSPDGYLNRASHYANYRTALASSKEEQGAYLDKALKDMDTASRYTERKGDAWYNRAKLIYGVVPADTTLTGDWTIDAAMGAIQQAIAVEDLPAYRQLEGDLHFSKGAYEQAYADYMIVNQSELATANSWYWAAKAMANVRGANFGNIIALLDTAIALCGNPPSSEAAPYILDRLDLRLKLLQYPEAVADYDLYYTVMRGQVGDGFYYYREQAKFRMNDFDGALEDIQRAIQLNPNDPNYPAEEASIYLRQEQYDQALRSVEAALRLAPDFASCYRLRGLCHIRQNKKEEACEAFRRAKELGDPLVDRLIKEHCP